MQQRLRENSGRDENQRFALLPDARCTLEQRSEVRDISQHGYLFHFGQIFVFKHATQYYRLAVAHQYLSYEVGRIVRWQNCCMARQSR